MPGGKITFDDFINDDFKKRLEELNIELGKSIQAFKAVAKEAQAMAKDVKAAKSFDDLNKASGKASASVNKLTDAEKRLERATKELAFQQSDEGKQLAKVNYEKQKAAKANRDLARSQDTGLKSTNKWSKAIGSFQFKFNALGNIAANAFKRITSGISKFISESTKMAAQVEGIRTAFRSMNDAGLLDKLRKAVKGTVSDIELMKAAVKARNFKIDLEQLPKYFEFAAKRAIETGESVDYLVESIVTGVARKSLPILDNLGLSATELRDEMARTGDMAKAVANIIDRDMGDSNKTVLTAAELYAQSAANAENLKVQFGEVANLFITKLLPAANKFVTFLREALMTRAMIERQVLDANIIYQIEQDRVEVQKLAQSYEEKRLSLKEGQTYEEKAALSLLGQYRTLLAETAEQDVKRIEQLSAQVKSLELMAGITPKSGSILDFEDLSEQWKTLKDELSGALNEEDQDAISFFGPDVWDTIKENAEGTFEELEKLSKNQTLMQAEELAQQYEDFKASYEKRKETVREVGDFIGDSTGSVYDFLSALTDRRISQLEAEAQSGIISERQYAAEKTRLARRAAIYDKVNALFKIGIDTASAIVEALPNVALAAAVGIIGAGSAAAVLAKPIPQYAKGVKRSGAGPAVVGEKGPELRIEPSGEMSLTPGESTLTYLKRGTEIKPADVTKKLLQYTTIANAMEGRASDAMIMAMMNEMKASNEKLRRELKNKPVASSTLTPAGILTAVHRGNTTIRKVDKYFK